MQLVAGFDVGHFLEHGHQLREVEELSKSCPRPVARTFRGKLDGCGGLAKGGCPAVEVGQLFLLEGAVLEGPPDRVQFGHGVADRRTGRKHYAAPAGDLIQVVAFAKHIRRFLRFTGG